MQGIQVPSLVRALTSHMLGSTAKFKKEIFYIEKGKLLLLMTDFVFLDSKITANMKLKDACSLEGKLQQT